MKINQTWEYVSKQLGRFHDWVNGGIPGSYYYVNDGIWYDMPIHHYHRKNENDTYDSGGEWLRYTRQITYGGDSQSIYRPGWGLAFTGRTKVAISSGSPLNGTQILQIFSDAKLKGAEAWNAMRPAKPSFNAALSIAELRELPRSLKIRSKDVRDSLIRWKSRSKRKSFQGKSAGNIVGDSYLSYMFGWLPLMRDVKNFVEAFNQRKKAFDQMLRDEGKPIKRGAKLSSPPDTSTTNRWYGGGTTGHNTDITPVFVTQCYVPGYNHLVYTEINVSEKWDTWCRGKFRYFLPPGPRDGPWKKKLYRRILGLRLTPSLIYNIIPWTWLIDYFAELGTFIDAISSGVEENLYAEYAYIMRTYTKTTTYTCTENVRKNMAGNGTTKVSTLVVVDTVKVRVKATPFGFGFVEENITPKQASIMGALGLSRL